MWLRQAACLALQITISLGLRDMVKINLKLSCTRRDSMQQTLGDEQ